MKKLIFIAFLGLYIPTVLWANAIYESMDKQGNVSFSDVASSGSKLIKIPPAQIFKSPKENLNKKPITPKTQESIKPFKYTTFKISTPANKATLRNNSGTINISVTIEPHLMSLATRPGPTLQFKLAPP